MKRFSLCIMALLVGVALTEAQEYSLDGQWQFYYAKDVATADSMVSAGFFSPNFVATDFKATPVPSCWAILGYEQPTYRNFKNATASEGLYICRFTLPANWKGKQLQLNFGGVWASTEIWLNGEWIGRHDSGFTSFAYSISKAAKVDKENVLAVRVRQVYKDYECDTYDDWALGGIYRSVTVTTQPTKQWIDEVRTQTKFADNYQRATVCATIMMGDGHKNTLPGNYRSPGINYDLQVTLLDAGGNKAAQWRQTIPGHTSRSRLVEANMNVDKPHLWNAEQPYLYTLKTELIERGKVTHTVIKKIGLREITTSGGVFRINGVAVKLRGVNRHDEWPNVGRATTREHWLKDLTMMKQANINYVRACHYQHAKGFIEMCDSIGMYVGAEISLGGAGGLMKDPGFYSGMATRIIETVNRDVDNPSIVYWSVGNEDGFNTMYYMAAKLTKSLDPTRPVLYPWNADSTLPSDIDILAPHYWTAHEYDSLAATSERPIITTEYVHSYGTERFGGLSDCWNALAKHPAGAGGAVWMWADQGIETPLKIDKSTFSNKVKSDYLRVSSAGWDGITDSYRNPTRDYWEVKAVYCPVVADTVAVTPKNGVVTITLRNGYDFTPLKDCKQQWKLMVDGTLIDSGIAIVEAAPHATGILTVPTKRLSQLEYGQTAYIRITTLNASGFEIGTSTVRLNVETKRKDKKGTLTVAERDGIITVTAADNTYLFSRATGSLVQAAKGTQPIVENLLPTVWHKLGDGESAIKNTKIANGGSLEKPQIKVQALNVSKSGEAARLTSRVEYFVNDSNQMVADYTFTICNTGRLTVEYTLTTDMQPSYLPFVGLCVQMADPCNLQRWFGKGPADAYPNKQTYPQLGLYEGTEVYGCKAVDWIEVGQREQTLRLSSKGYLVRDKSNAQVLRLCPNVLGRSEKGRLKDSAYMVLPKGTYKGALYIE